MGQGRLASLCTSNQLVVIEALKFFITILRFLQKLRIIKEFTNHNLYTVQKLNAKLFPIAFIYERYHSKFQTFQTKQLT